MKVLGACVVFAAEQMPHRTAGFAYVVLNSVGETVMLCNSVMVSAWHFNWVTDRDLDTRKRKL